MIKTIFASRSFVLISVGQISLLNNDGSLEGICSGEAIARIAKEKGLAITESKEVFDLYLKQNKIAVNVIHGVCCNIAKGIAAIAHVVDPD